MALLKGTIRKLSLEGGLWALITDDGDTVELIDPPNELCKNGQRAEIDAQSEQAEVTIGMVGTATRVRRYRLL